MTNGCGNVPDVVGAAGLATAGAAAGKGRDGENKMGVVFICRANATSERTNLPPPASRLPSSSRSHHPMLHQTRKRNQEPLCMRSGRSVWTVVSGVSFRTTTNTPTFCRGRIVGGCWCGRHRRCNLDCRCSLGGHTDRTAGRGTGRRRRRSAALAAAHRGEGSRLCNAER